MNDFLLGMAFQAFVCAMLMAWRTQLINPIQLFLNGLILLLFSLLQATT
jgi:hypothetical protein